MKSISINLPIVHLSLFLIFVLWIGQIILLVRWKNYSQLKSVRDSIILVPVKKFSWVFPFTKTGHRPKLLKTSIIAANVTVDIGADFKALRIGIDYIMWKWYPMNGSAKSIWSRSHNSSGCSHTCNVVWGELWWVLQQLVLTSLNLCLMLWSNSRGLISSFWWH